MIQERKGDLWDHLLQSDKKIVLWGMGNGADKIINELARRSLSVSAVFASNGFARGNLFHSMPVLTWERVKEQWGSDGVIVLLAFGSSRPDVLENILRVASECELYAPDVPAFGDALFDAAFFAAHREELEQARALLSDEESRFIFDSVVSYKLSGDIETLLAARSDEEITWKRIVCPASLTSAADLGAYNGDTVRQLLARAEGQVRTVWAMEPDAKTFQKLNAYANEENRATVHAVNAGAWSENTVLTFDKSSNRNASFLNNRSQVLAARPVKTEEVRALTLDAVLDGARVDYVKYDVEGAEREALLGSYETIMRYRPLLMVSLYHRSEDLFALPLLVHTLFPHYKGFYLRRFGGIPAWDLNLYVREE